ncbi:dihydrofolate reductase-like [Tigriopus californicus]|uniref:dihydrofolate reductase-like n=1 Tax=Tigriopus californicus TaxID=6832 RepID=UPI0027DA6535|nr:dihydrofolate reductase-like [Tigriopus californicus]
MKLYLIVAACEGMGIGLNGGLPWRLKEEVKYFARMTKATQDPQKMNAVIMGRKTWESIPEKFRPLKERFNVVLSRQNHLVLSDPNTLVCSSLSDALSKLKAKGDELETFWLIGGHALYLEAMEKQLVDRIYLTDIQCKFDCDTFFPAINADEYESITDETVPDTPQREGDVAYVYKVLQRRRSEL